MKRIVVPTTGGADWKRGLAKPDLHWVRGRSAMSAAASWEAADDRLPPEISAALDANGDEMLRGLELLVAVPEWEVQLEGGSRPSCTDIMAVARNDTGLVVIAVEAKVDETFGPTLGEKRHGASAGQSRRLESLHEILGQSAPFPDAIRYQLLHRTASAILTARAFHAGTAVMIVQSFCPNSSWFEEYAAFAEAMGAEAVKDRACAVPGHAGPRLFVAWSAGDRRFSEVMVP